jgi:hypothetical protein
MIHTGTKAGLVDLKTMAFESTRRQLILTVTSAVDVAE